MAESLGQTFKFFLHRISLESRGVTQSSSTLGIFAFLDVESSYGVLLHRTAGSSCLGLLCVRSFLVTDAPLDLTFLRILLMVDLVEDAGASL